MSAFGTKRTSGRPATDRVDLSQGFASGGTVLSDPRAFCEVGSLVAEPAYKPRGCHSIERAIGAFKMHRNDAIKEQIASNRSNHRSME